VRDAADITAISLVIYHIIFIIFIIRKSVWTSDIYDGFFIIPTVLYLLRTCHKLLFCANVRCV